MGCEAKVDPESQEAVVEPKEQPRGLLQIYKRLLHEHPLKTNAANSFFLSALGNLISQRLSGVSLDLREALSCGLRECPPYSHCYYMKIEDKLGEGSELLKVHAAPLCVHLHCGYTRI